MKPTIKIFIYLLLFLIFQHNSAQDTLSLKNTIEIVLEKNYGIKIIANEQKITENNNTVGNAGMLPTIVIDGSKTLSDFNTHQVQNNDAIKDLANAHSDVVTSRATLNWTIFDGFSMFVTKQKLSQLEELGKVRAQQVILDIVQQTISTYFNIVQQEKILHSIGNALEISNERVKLAETKLQIGSGSELNLLQARLDRNSDSSEYLSQLILIKNTKADLNRIMALEDSLNFVVQPEIPIDETLNYSYLFNKVLEQNPDIKAAQLNLRVAELNRKILNSYYFPRVNVFAGYNYSNNISQAGFFKENRQSGLQYGITASFTIFNGFQARRTAVNARIEYESSQIALQQNEQNVKNEFWKLFNEYESQVKLVKLETENAEAAHKSTALSFQIYKQGMMSDIDFRTAQQKQLDADIRLLSAQYIAKLKETQLKALSGELLK